MSDDKYKSYMPITFKEGYKVGKKDAKDILNKTKPKTTRGIINAKNKIKDRINTEYSMHHLEWLKGFHHGAYDTIMEYQENLIKNP